MRQFPRRCLALGNQFAQISSFFLRQLYDILLHGGLLLVEQWFGFSCSSRIPLFPSTHHFIMDRTLVLSSYRCRKGIFYESFPFFPQPSPPLPPPFKPSTPSTGRPPSHLPITSSSPL